MLDENRTSSSSTGAEWIRPLPHPSGKPLDPYSGRVLPSNRQAPELSAGVTHTGFRFALVAGADIPLRTTYAEAATMTGDIGYTFFKVGLFVAVAGLIAWIVLSIIGAVGFGIAAACVSALGAQVSMFAVLLGRRRETSGSHS